MSRNTYACFGKSVEAQTTADMLVFLSLEKYNTEKRKAPPQ